MTGTVAAGTRKSLRFIHDDCEFYPHQIDGIRELARKGNFILADEMGLGKSLQALTVFAIDCERGTARRALVVCPVTLKGNWLEEIHKHTSFAARILIGNPKERQDQLDDFVVDCEHILIVNYEQVITHYQDLNAIGFDVVIYDEAHMMKNPKASRTKGCHGLIARRHFLLTGSPLLNNVHELWSLLYRIDPASFPNYYRFLNRYAVFGGYKNKQIVGIKNESEIHELLGDRMLRRLKKDVLDLPDKQYIPVWCELLPEQRELYRELFEEATMTLPNNPTPVDIENGLEKFLRLKQVCGTTAAVGYGQDISGKLDEAVDRAKELMDNGHKLVVFTQFRDVQRAYTQRLAKAGLTYIELNGDVPQERRQEYINTWSNHNGPAALVAMLQVASVGLNMTAARHAFFLDKLWVPKLNEQAEDRLHRIGQDTTQPVQIYHFMCRRTIEQRIESLLKRKVKIFNTLVETPDFKKKLYQALLQEDDDE